MHTRSPAPRDGPGFTLVEILIVVVILGILSAIVVPQFSNATQDSKLTATLEQLRHLRNAIDVYSLQHSSRIPQIEEGDGTWGELSTMGYLKRTPVNHWVGGDHATEIILSDTADEVFSADHGWIYHAPSGEDPYPRVWAAGFDDQDFPLAPS